MDSQKAAEFLKTCKNKVPSSSREFTSILIKTCNISMPYTKNHPRGQPMYWWNDEIAQKRKEYISEQPVDLH